MFLKLCTMEKIKRQIKKKEHKVLQNAYNCKEIPLHTLLFLKLIYVAPEKH